MADEQDPTAGVTEFLDLREQHGHPDLITHHMRPSKPGFLVPPAELRASRLRAILAENQRVLSLLLGHPRDPDPAPWTDPDTGTVHDLLQAFTDRLGARWEHCGWLHRLGPAAPPGPLLVLLGDDPPIEAAFANVNAEWGPLTQAGAP